MDGQQAGDVLDDDFPGQFDGTVAVVGPLSLRLIPAGFLKDGQTEGETAGPEETNHLIKSGLDEKLLTDCFHCEKPTQSDEDGPTVQKDSLSSDHLQPLDKSA